eukprot:m.170173 g.170173  ORF g.170173 m.170173 type:complete len:537 (-) comp31604_c1_seq7:233-1843(-)
MALSTILLLCLVFSDTRGEAPVIVPSCGCDNVQGNPRTLDAKVEIASSGVQRDYRLFTPKRDQGDTTPVPLFLVLHGYTSTPEIVARDSLMEDVGELMNFAVAFPRGLDPGPGTGWSFPGCNAIPAVGVIDDCGRNATCDEGYETGCNVVGCPSPVALEHARSATCGKEHILGVKCDSPAKSCRWCGCEDDESFVRNVVEHIGNTQCINLAQVYLSGMSAGGMFTSWLSSRTGDIFAGYAPVSGTNPRGFREQHRQVRHAFMLWIHGRQDPTVPYDGSRSTRDNGWYWYESVKTDAADAAAEFGCDVVATHAPDIENLTSVPQGLQSPMNLVCNEHLNCTVGVGLRVAYCLWDGVHIWAGSAYSIKKEGERNFETPEKYWGSILLARYLLPNYHGDIQPQNCSKPALTLSPTTAIDTTTRAAKADHENNQQDLPVGAVGVGGALVLLVVVAVVVLVFRRKIMTNVFQAKKLREQRGTSAYNKLNHFNDENTLQTSVTDDSELLYQDPEANDADDQMVVDIDESHKHTEQIEVESTA